MKTTTLLRITTVIFSLFLATCKKDELQPEPAVAAHPLITTFTPASGSVGTQVTIAGNNFNEAATLNAIKFNGITAVVQSATTTQLITTVPVGAATGKIAVTVNGVTTASQTEFAVTVPSASQPEITSFTPEFGYTDTQVTITGTNFSATSASNTIKFNGITAVVKMASTTQLVTALPAGAATGKISVTVNGSTGISSTDFIVLVPETITSFTPTSGSAGAIVTITGTNFSTTIADNVVLFNGHEATITSATSTTLVVTVPAGATTGRISVTINGVDAISSSDFIVH